MFQTNTFLEFIKNSDISSKIQDSVFNYCEHHHSFLCQCIYDYDVYRVVDVSGVDIHINAVWIDNNKESSLNFDIAVEVDAEVEGVYGKHHDHDCFNSHFWLLINCKGDLKNKLNDFKIVGIYEYDGKSKPKKPLSGDLVPIIKKEDYDTYATEILEKYYPEALNSAIRVDAEVLAKRMKLTIVEANITNDKSVFGQCFFNDTIEELYDSEGNTYKQEIKKGTILVDSFATFLYSFGSRSMTIAHECVHAYYHGKAFMFAQLFDKDLKFIGCKVNGGTQGLSTSPVYWMERQANGIAPCILMPFKAFQEYALKLIKDYHQIYGGNVIDLLPHVIEELAKTYDVTIYAAKKRLLDVGIHEAAGVNNWVDDKYIRPFYFAKGSLQKDETFTISIASFSHKLLFSNKDLFMDLLEGKYEFVENHIVLNDPIYIKKNHKGDLVLTEYARLNLDKCAVKFKCKAINNEYDNSLSTICYLCRDVSKEVEFDLQVTKNPNIIFSKEGQEKHTKHSENVNEIVKNISSMRFGEILKYLMGFLQISEKELSIDADVDERTIRRYLNGENKDPNKKTIVAIIRALDLPPRVSDIILKRAGISLVDGDVVDDAIVDVLMCFRESNYREVNRFFTMKTGEPLTKHKS